MIRELGSLGKTWTHQWREDKTKSLKNIALPLDQPKKIFKVSQLEGLTRAVYIAIPESKPYLRAGCVAFLTEYVNRIEILTKSEEYEPGEIDILEGYIERAYKNLLQIAGIEGLTNYFHYFGSGHIVWLTRTYGNLWRYRNEGVESMNGVLSLRYNKFNNRGGNKGSNLDGNNDKCEGCLLIIFAQPIRWSYFPPCMRRWKKFHMSTWNSGGNPCMHYFATKEQYLLRFKGVHKPVHVV